MPMGIAAEVASGNNECVPETRQKVVMARGTPSGSVKVEVTNSW